MFRRRPSPALSRRYVLPEGNGLPELGDEGWGVILDRDYETPADEFRCEACCTSLNMVLRCLGVRDHTGIHFVYP